MKPRLFYRFISLEGQRLEWLRETIETGTLYAAAVASFNDPFEFRFTIDFEATPGMWRTFLEANRDLAGLPPSESITEEFIEHRIKNMKALPSPVSQQIVDQVKETTLVICFSKVADNELLWAHYANGHRGVCLEFCQTKRDSLFTATHRVHYRRELPVIGFPETDYLSAGARIALTKGEAWRYEREYRLVLSGVPRRVPFRPEELTRVILGARVSARDRVAIEGWLKGGPTTIAHAVPRRGRFGVEFAV
jgi:hypothetical protein